MRAATLEAAVLVYGWQWRMLATPVGARTPCRVLSTRPVLHRLALLGGQLGSVTNFGRTPALTHLGTELDGVDEVTGLLAPDLGQ